MITPVKTDKGEVQPFEHYTYAQTAGNLYAGCAAAFNSSGLLSAVSGTEKPTHISLVEANPGVTVLPEDIPAIRVQKDVIYESVLTTAASGLKLGSGLKLNSEGTGFVLAASGDTPVAECVSFEGTAASSAIRVRFI